MARNVTLSFDTVEKKLNVYLDYNWSEEYLTIEGMMNDQDSVILRELEIMLDDSVPMQNWRIEFYLKMADVCLNEQCAASSYQHSFGRIDSFMKTSIKSAAGQPNQKHVSLQNSEVVLYEDVRSLALRHITVMLKVRLSEATSPSFKVPHLFGSLSCTEAGVEILRGRMVAEGLLDKLENPDSSLQDLTGILWAIGFIGSTSYGMKYLSSLDGLLDRVFVIAQSAQELPLKSVALNVVNMFAQNTVGRDLLEVHNWSIHALKQDETGECDFICTPKEVSSFLKIETQNKTWEDTFILPRKYTNFCRNLVVHIKETNDDDKEREFIEMVEKLPNRQLNSKPVSALIHGKDFSLFNNTKLFFLLFILLTCYNLTVSVRRNMFTISDYFLIGVNFIVLLDNDTHFEEFLKI